MKNWRTLPDNVTTDEKMKLAGFKSKNTGPKTKLIYCDEFETMYDVNEWIKEQKDGEKRNWEIRRSEPSKTLLLFEVVIIKN